MTESVRTDGALILAQAEHGPAQTQAGAQAPGGAHGGGGSFPPFDSSTFAGQLLWLAIFFGLLYWLMKKVALPRVGNILEGRAERISADLAEANRLKGEADAAIAAYEKALADARAEGHRIAAEMHEKVTAEAEAQQRKLEDDLNARLEVSDRQIAEAKATALSNVRGIAVDAASAIVERLTGAPAQAGEVEQAVDASLAA